MEVPVLQRTGIFNLFKIWPFRPKNGQKTVIFGQKLPFFAIF